MGRSQTIKGSVSRLLRFRGKGGGRWWAKGTVTVMTLWVGLTALLAGERNPFRFSLVNP